MVRLQDRRETLLPWEIQRARRPGNRRDRTKNRVVHAPRPSQAACPPCLCACSVPQAARNCLDGSLTLVNPRVNPHFVVYYRHSGEERHLSFVVISESLHDTIAVFLFQKTLLSFLKEALPCTPEKIIYFSHGAASQYKNRKNFLNLCYHEKDFGIRAEWHFSATSHGKGACDGVGGTVKRLATKASLQKPFDEQIMTPLQLFEWASANITGTIFRFCSCSDYEQTKEMLEPRFTASRTIPGTRKLHCFIPCSMETVQVRTFSRSDISKLERVTIKKTELVIDCISGYATCDYSGQWWHRQRKL